MTDRLWLLVWLNRDDEEDDGCGDDDYDDEYGDDDDDECDDDIKNVMMSVMMMNDNIFSLLYRCWSRLSAWVTTRHWPRV